MTASTTLNSAPYAGASGSVAVATTRDCTWSATTSSSWISITDGTSGQGDGTVAFRVAANPDPIARRGTVRVNDATVDLAQDAAPCRFTVAASQTGVAASGGSIRVSVTASSAACSWTAASNAPWLAIVDGASGSGTGAATIGVATNNGEVREGSVVVAGETIVIRQDAAGTTTPPPVGCAYSVTPTDQSVGAGGGPASVSVTASPATCAWSAQSDASWITVTSGSGTGNGTAAFSVATNSGGARTATLTIGTATATVSQAAAACSFAIAPGSANFGAAGGSSSVAVTITAGAGCAWTASANVSWISITSGTSGTGNGTVAFTVSANAGGARSTSMTIAGRSFAVTQDAAPCSYSIAPTTQAVPAAGGTGSFAVTSRGGCAWTATSNADWIAITSGSSGNGNGTVAFSAAPNAGAARSGTITVGGQTFTVTQPAPCAYSIAPLTQAVPAAGGTGSVAVTTGAGCAWTAVANVPWISITSGASGSGNGTVAISVAANTSTTPRTGTATIAGQTFTVNQDAAPAPCTFTIAPTSQNVDVGGGGGSVTVTTGPSCSWTAVSNNPDWLGVLSGASGTGSGTVTFGAAPNGTGMPRTGTLTIGGQPFTVNQGS